MYFLFSGEKRKVPKKKAAMPPNTSAVEGFEAITRRSDGEGEDGGDGVLLSFQEKRKKNQERKAMMPADSIRRGEGLKPLRTERWGGGFVLSFFGRKKKGTKEKSPVRQTAFAGRLLWKRGSVTGYRP